MTFRNRLKYFLPLLLLGVAAKHEASAATVPYSGSFAADNSFLSLTLSPTVATNYTFNTTSYATGGFLTDLTLANSAGKVLGSSQNATPSDALLSILLGPGSYLLFLTELPNEADGSGKINLANPSSSFLFGSDPLATSTIACGNGKMFNDPISCTQRSSAYSLNVTSTAATPEPSTLLLMLAPAGALVGAVRRRRALA